MSYAATRSCGGNHHRSHSNSNNLNSNSNNNNNNTNSNQNFQHHHHHHNPHPHQHHHSHQNHHSHHHHNHNHHNPHLQHQSYVGGQQHAANGIEPQAGHLQQQDCGIPLPAGGSSSSSVSSSTSSSHLSVGLQAPVAASAGAGSVACDPASLAPASSIVADSITATTTLTAGHSPANLQHTANNTQQQAGAQQPGPPHYVDLHVNAGECVSLQLFDGQEQLVAGPATITLVSQQQNPPVPIPVQVPPGHMIHQIADENGTLKHIILSVMDPSAPPAAADATSLDSTVITLPQGANGATATAINGSAFWNSNQTGAIYHQPAGSYNNIVATSGGTTGGQNNYQQSPSGATNHIYSNGASNKQQQQQQPAPPPLVPNSGYPSTLNHHHHHHHGPPPAHFRGGASGGSISPMRSRAKGQHHHQQQHHHNHSQHHHNSHHNNHNVHNNHHHQQQTSQPNQQQHHVHRSASSSSSTTHSNHTHYHPSSINNNGKYPHAASGQQDQQASVPSNKQQQHTTGDDQHHDSNDNNQQQAAAQDKSGPAWQPGNRFTSNHNHNHNQQQVQSKSPSLPATSGQLKQQQQQKQLAVSPAGKSAGRRSKDRQQPSVDQSPVKKASPEAIDTTRVSRGKQKKHPAATTVTTSEQTDITALENDILAVEKETKKEKSQSPSRQPELEKKSLEGGAIKEEPTITEEQRKVPEEAASTDETAVAPKESPARSLAAINRSKAKLAMRTSFSENNIQCLETSNVASHPRCNSPAASVVKSTQTTPRKTPQAVAANLTNPIGGLKSSLPSSDENSVEVESLLVPQAASVSKKNKSTSVESSKRRRSSKGSEPKLATSGGAGGGLKLNALPQLKLLNLSCTSVTSSSVQLRWSYVPSLAEKYGIHNHHHHHSKHTHILDHFVIETSSDKNVDSNQLIASRVVYQGCAMTCRVLHLQADKIYHFRVRRTALVNATVSAASAASAEPACAPSKQEHLVVSEILSVTLPSIQPVQQQQQQQSKKKGASSAAGMVISSATSYGGADTCQASQNVANRGNASSHQQHNNSNHNNHHLHNHGGNKSSSHHHQQTTTIKLSNLSRQCRTKFVSMFGRMVKNSLSSCSDTKFAGLLLVLFTIFAMLLAIFIHLYFVAPVIES